MMLRESFGLLREAAWIEAAGTEVLRLGFRTFDMAEPGTTLVGTAEMGRGSPRKSSAGHYGPRRGGAAGAEDETARFCSSTCRTTFSSAGARAPVVGGRAQRGAAARRGARNRGLPGRARRDVGGPRVGRPDAALEGSRRPEVRARHAGTSPAGGARARRGRARRVEDVFLRLLRAGAWPPRSAGADTLLVAGVHLHGCVRATVLDAYAHGLAVWVAEDAVGSDDPLHAAVTRRYLDGRAARFAPVDELLARVAAGAAPGPEAGRYAAEAARASAAARRAAAAWSAAAPEERARPLEALAERLEAEAPALARALATEVGKPVTLGEAEVRRTAELLRRAAALRLPGPSRAGPASSYRRVPLGVVAVVTPWNNPLAIPWGKIGPALALGNTVVWKPAPAATRLAERSLDAARDARLPDGVVTLVPGDRRAAAAVMSDPGVDAVSVSGSSAAGWAAQEICARRRIPLQAELGGNNAAIVWEGADLRARGESAGSGSVRVRGPALYGEPARRRAGSASSTRSSSFSPRRRRRCPGAIRFDPATRGRSSRVRGSARPGRRRARGRGRRRGSPGHAPYPRAEPPGGLVSATIVVGAAHESAIVQEETFGPVLVLERASSFDEALRLANGVRQGLVAALFAGPGAWCKSVSERRGGRRPEVECLHLRCRRRRALRRLEGVRPRAAGARAGRRRVLLEAPGDL